MQGDTRQQRAERANSGGEPGAPIPIAAAIPFAFWIWLAGALIFAGGFAVRLEMFGNQVVATSSAVKELRSEIVASQSLLATRQDLAREVDRISRLERLREADALVDTAISVRLATIEVEIRGLRSDLARAERERPRPRQPPQSQNGREGAN